MLLDSQIDVLTPAPAQVWATIHDPVPMKGVIAMVVLDFKREVIVASKGLPFPIPVQVIVICLFFAVFV